MPALQVIAVSQIGNDTHCTSPRFGPIYLDRAGQRSNKAKLQPNVPLSSVKMRKTKQGRNAMLWYSAAPLTSLLYAACAGRTDVQFQTCSREGDQVPKPGLLHTTSRPRLRNMTIELKDQFTRSEEVIWAVSYVCNRGIIRNSKSRQKSLGNVRSC